jgi:hypothetical protein
MVQYRNLDDELIEEVLEDREGYQRAKTIFIILIILFPIIGFIIGGLDGAIFSFFIAILVGGVLVLRSWWWMRGSEKRLDRKRQIEQDFKRK